MKRIIVIDLPAFCQGNLHQVDVLLLYETLREIKKLKNVELMFGEGDSVLLAGNQDYTFTNEVWEFLSEIKMISYDISDRKDNVTHNPGIIDASYSNDMKDCIYLQLCVMHVKDNPYGTVTFVGFIPRFSNKFQLETTRDKKTRKHHTEIFADKGELLTWTIKCKPHLDQKKHMAKERNSAMGMISPFTSYYKLGEQYADDLLQKAYIESEDEAEFPHYLYTWDAEAGTFVEFRHENHEGDSHHDYHGRDLSSAEYDKVPQYLRLKYHR